MEIFISWSGDRSHAVALALRNWLPKIVNAFKPWLSSSDLEKGTRWGVDVAKRLNTANAGIICLTHDNLHSDWIHFEAGALSKVVDSARVCTLLIDLETSDLEPPLSQFQATRTSEDEVLELMKSLNRLLGESALSDEHVSEAFHMCWPTLKAELDKLPENKSAGRPIRTERQLIEEILAHVRNLNAPGQSLLDEDREHILRGRASKIIFGRKAASLSTSSDGKNIKIEVTGGDDSKFTVTIPKDTPLTEIERHILAQLPPEKDELPPAEPKTAGP